MGTLNAPEIREISMSPKERAKARDLYVRDFDRQFADWAGIADCCLAVDRDRDWEILQFHSFHAWLLDAAPASRSYLYLVMGYYKKLILDIPAEELAEIPLGSAGVLASMSSTVRRDPKIRKAAKKKPGEFIREVQEMAPEQHVEGRHRVTLDFPLSAWTLIENAYQKFQELGGPASLETFVEFLVSEVNEWTFHATQEARVQ